MSGDPDEIERWWDRMQREEELHQQFAAYGWHRVHCRHETNKAGGTHEPHGSVDALTGFHEAGFRHRGRHHDDIPF